LQKYAVGSIHKEEEKESDDDDDDRSDVYYDAPDTLVPISITVPIPARTLTLSAPSSNKQIIEKKSKSKQWIKSLLKLLLKGKGAYWVMLYLLLRGPVETMVHKLVAKTRFIQSQRLQATTIGITAIIAATASNSLASLLQK
jgi:hypothetical protein